MDGRLGVYTLAGSFAELRNRETGEQIRIPLFAGTLGYGNRDLVWYTPWRSTSSRVLSGRYEVWFGARRMTGPGQELSNILVLATRDLNL